MAPPTAVHAVADVHDAANRKLEVAPVGLGVGWIVHAVPSQRSANA